MIKEAICFKCLQDFFVAEDALSYTFLIIVHFFREPRFERYEHFGIKAGLIAMLVRVQVNNAFTLLLALSKLAASSLKIPLKVFSC
jgi:hypothetical protein